jgi:hypothetical protein
MAQNFQKLIGNSNNNRLGKAILNADNYYVIGKNGIKATVSKLDNNGNIQWTTETSSEAFWNDIIINQDGNVMVVGSQGDNNPSTNNKSLCAVINANTGVFIHHKSFDLGYQELLFRIYYNPSANKSTFPYYVSGSKITNSGSTDDDLFILAFDKDFNLDLGGFYSNPGMDTELFRDLFIGGRNGRLMCIGNSNTKGVTLNISKNLKPDGGREFNQPIVFRAGLSTPNPLDGFHEILAGETTDGTADAIILRANANSLTYSYKIPALKTITYLAYGQNGSIFANGKGEFGGIDKNVILNFQDNGTSLSLNWAKILDQGETAFDDGFVSFVFPDKLLITDSRSSNASGFGGFDGLFCVEQISMENCMDANVNVQLVNNPMAILGFNINFSEINQIMYSKETGSYVSYLSNNPCAPLCHINLQIDGKANDACGQYTFNGTASGGTPPYTFQWDFGCNGSIESTANPASIQLGSGTQPYCVTVTDAANCQKILTNQTVVVPRDLIPPVINCPQSVVIDRNPNDCFGVYAPLINITDNCDPMPSCNCVMSGATIGNMPKNTLVQFNIGVTTVNCTAKDAAGNDAQPCVFIVSVNDSPSFTINCPSDLTISCEQDENDLNLTGQAFILNNCSDVLISHIDTYSGNSCLRTIMRKWTAQTNTGTVTLCTQSITQVDSGSPTIICPPSNVNPIECTGDINPANLGVPSLSDDCTRVNYTFSDAINDVGCNRTITRTFTVTDECGNTNSCVQEINITDTKPPIILGCGRKFIAQGSKSMSGECNAILTIPSPSVSDLCSNITKLLSNDYNNTDNAGGTYPVGQTIIIWTAKDGCGQMTMCQDTVIVHPCPESCDCKQIEIVINPHEAGPIKVPCNSKSPIAIPCSNSPYISINGALLCNGSCDNRIKWSILLGNTLINSGTNNIIHPITDWNISIPKTGLLNNVDYTIQLEGICGLDICRCSFIIKIERCACPDNLLSNGSFNIGMNEGDLNDVGAAQSWTSVFNSPQVETNAGCLGNGSIKMWGNQIEGEGIITPVSFSSGTTYNISLYAKWLREQNRPYPAQLRLMACNGTPTNYNNPSNCMTILISPVLSDLACQNVSSTFVCPTNFDQLFINPWNQSNFNHGDSVTFVRVDDICLTAMSPSLNVTGLSLKLQKRIDRCHILFTTISEINNAGFDIERSSDGTLFEKIGWVAGLGNSNETKHYAFIDTKPMNGINYYRLRQVDYDGKFDYTQVVNVVFEFNDIYIYPNPAFNILNVHNFNGAYLIKSITGANMKQDVLRNDNEIDISQLPSGIYLFYPERGVPIKFSKI